jgi:hypothetical protein
MIRVLINCRRAGPLRINESTHARAELYFAESVLSETSRSRGWKAALRGPHGLKRTLKYLQDFGVRRTPYECA